MAKINILGSRLPSIYQEVEWIQSNSSQYIKTNYTEHAEYQIDCKMENTGTAKSNYWFGQNQAHGSMMYNGFYNINSLEYNWLNVSLTGDARNNLKEMYQVKDGTNCIITINGVSYTKAIGTNDSTGNFLIFACNSARLYGSPLKLYWFKMHDGDEMILDLVPCYRKEDGVIGVYDLVSGDFLINQGSDTFTKGDDVETIIEKHSYKKYITNSGVLLKTCKKYVNTSNGEIISYK